MGDAVLGGAPVALPGIDPAARDAHTAGPRVYGFHATLKAPFRLALGRREADLLDALRAFGAVRPPAGRVTLRLAQFGRFLALAPAEDSRDLDLLAAELVASFDGFRAPLTAEDRERRLKASLSPRQAALLDAWGYPYVFETFRFHMTLTGSLPDRDLPRWRAALEPLCRDLPPVDIDAVTLVVQAEPGFPFRILERVALEGSR